jgi:hypothetical protein
MSANVPLSYNSGTYNSNTGTTVLEIVEGLNEAAEAEGEDQTPLGGVGEFPRNWVKRRRRIVINGRIKATTPSAFRTAVKALHAIWVVGETHDLVATLEDATTATIAARVEACEAPQWSDRTAQVTITLVSKAPDWTIT